MTKQKAMANKSKEARYIVLPVYVVNIGLFYTFLLTIGLILAWITIYRHEGCIKELRQMLNEKQKHLTDMGEEVDLGNLDADIHSDEEKLPHLLAVRSDSVQRSKRHNQQQHGQKGDRGRDGIQGPPGSPGPSGVPGHNGIPGSPGVNGLHGLRGVKGDRGEKGNRGHDGQTFSESAHIVGSGKKVRSTPTALRKIYTVVSWKRDHSTTNMVYDNNGYLKVNVAGYYLIYSQMLYIDGDNPTNGHEMYIDDREVLKATYSVVNKTRKYHTQYISGIFFINKGQKISVGTRVSRDYFFDEVASFFGACLLHH